MRSQAVRRGAGKPPKWRKHCRSVAHVQEGPSSGFSLIMHMLVSMLMRTVESKGICGGGHKGTDGVSKSGDYPMLYGAVARPLWLDSDL